MPFVSIEKAPVAPVSELSELLRKASVSDASYNPDVCDLIRKLVKQRTNECKICFLSAFNCVLLQHNVMHLTQYVHEERVAL